jgi:hypothetical protein
LASASVIFCCAAACETAVAAAAARSATAVPVSSARRGMRWQSFLPVIHDRLPIRLDVPSGDFEAAGHTQSIIRSSSAPTMVVAMAAAFGSGTPSPKFAQNTRHISSANFGFKKGDEH